MKEAVFMRVSQPRAADRSRSSREYLELGLDMAHLLVHRRFSLDQFFLFYTVAHSSPLYLKLNEDYNMVGFTGSSRGCGG